MPDRSDPETAYRRGYQHGARETFRAVEQWLDPATRTTVRKWIETDVQEWRLHPTLGTPPTWRLRDSNIRKSNRDTCGD
jgi:hypothetical protein